jgi:phosphoglycolate phosphatase
MCGIEATGNYPASSTKGEQALPCITVLSKSYDTDLVIFDKDGTLLDFEKSWVGIIRDLIADLGSHVPMSPALKERIENALGVSVDYARIDGNGLLAMGTFLECNALLTYCLYREGLRWDRAQKIVEATGRKAFGPESRRKHIQAAPGALELLETLKSRGIPAAVATNDRKDDAILDMELIGALPYIELVIGADSVENSKPAPDMVERICSLLGKDPARAVLIGDTVMDAMLGKNAGVMLTVGVKGIVAPEELARHMDVVVSSLEEIS